YVLKGKGCRVTDVDGVERIDFANNMASHIHGHAFEPIVEAVSKQLQCGTAFTLATEAEVTFAEHLCSRNPAFDKVRFVNSGTEAVMAGMKAARAYTGRPKIAKVEGSYHGAYDYAEVSQAPTPENWGDSARPNAVPLAQGTPQSVSEDMVVLPFNEPEQSIAILDHYKDQIACILIDPVPHRIGMSPAGSTFVTALRKWATDKGALLMFDEVITFRTEYGGAQVLYDVRPDLTSMGKMIGGGFPVGALAGRGDVMRVFTNGRLPHSGTFSANPVTMTAGRVAMAYFDRDAVAKLNRLGDYARASLAQLFQTLGVPACVTGAGSLLRMHMKPAIPANFREAHPTEVQKRALSTLINDLYDDGFMLIHTGAAALSTVMTEAEVDCLVESVASSMTRLKPLLLETVQ
uniref:aspartate aminotransferase family protein n=1 Tax=Sedimenticola sp. TaxID=1940285 RepID=UPI003D1529BF